MSASRPKKKATFSEWFPKWYQPISEFIDTCGSTLINVAEIVNSSAKKMWWGLGISAPVLAYGEARAHTAVSHKVDNKTGDNRPINYSTRLKLYLEISAFSSHAADGGATVIMLSNFINKDTFKSPGTGAIAGSTAVITAFFSGAQERINVHRALHEEIDIPENKILKVGQMGTEFLGTFTAMLMMTSETLPYYGTAVGCTAGILAGSAQAGCTLAISDYLEAAEQKEEDGKTEEESNDHLEAAERKEENTEGEIIIHAEETELSLRQWLMVIGTFAADSVGKTNTFVNISVPLVMTILNWINWLRGENEEQENIGVQIGMNILGLASGIAGSYQDARNYYFAFRMRNFAELKAAKEKHAIYAAALMEEIDKEMDEDRRRGTTYPL